MLQKSPAAIATTGYFPAIGFLFLATVFVAPAHGAILFEPFSASCASPLSSASTGLLPERDGVRGLNVFGTCENDEPAGEVDIGMTGLTGVGWEFSVSSALDYDVDWSMLMNLNQQEVLYRSGSGPSDNVQREINEPVFVPAETTVGFRQYDRPSDGSAFSIVIPPNSADWGTDPAEELPEPGTLLGGLAALVMLAGRGIRGLQAVRR